MLSTLLVLALAPRSEAQIDQLLPEIDTYYKISSPVRIWFQAKETREDGTPVTAEIGPSIDFSVKAPHWFADVTSFDLDESKSRLLIFSIGYRYLPTPSEPPTNRLLPFFTLNYPLPKIRFLLSDRNRADLNWRAGNFTWRYRNRIQLEKSIRIGRYHPSPYASAEFFYNSQYGKWSDTAIYLGCNFPFAKHFEFNSYYEHQNNTGNSPNQVYNQLGLMLNMYFSRH